MGELVRAGGCFLLAAAGVVLPGVPALPFLALSAHHAVRGSPALGEILRRKAWSAPLLEWVEAPENPLLPDPESLPKLMAIAALAAPVLWIVRPPLLVLIGLELGVMAYACSRGAADARDPLP
jgi:uncharacterized membrane protein YbaN (DUF454 family)